MQLFICISAICALDKKQNKSLIETTRANKVKKTIMVSHQRTNL